VAAFAATLSLAVLAGDAPNPMVDGLMKGDLNADGVLTEDEVLPGIFSLLDTNNDGRAERAEVEALYYRTMNAAGSNQRHMKPAHGSEELNRCTGSERIHCTVAEQAREWRNARRGPA
jgi:hypothetical protein